MSMSSRLLLLLSLALVAGSAFARKADLVNPDPIPIPAGLSQEQVVKDIKRSLTGRGWAVALEEPGHIESTLNLREHYVRIKILYDAQAISLGYMESRNLDYKQSYDGKRTYIHPNYLNWINFLTKDIANNMQFSATEK